MKLIGKTRSELEACLAGKSRGELVDLVFSLVTFERLLTAREIAEASHVAKRDVLAEMKAGRFVDPIFGRGFFCRAFNSLRVSASAANAWRLSFFVPVAVPPHKKEDDPPASSWLPLDQIGRQAIATHKKGSSETDFGAENSGQKAIRSLSPVHLGRGHLAYQDNGK